MNNNITQLLIIAYAIVPFTNALVGLVKKTFPKLQSNFIPMISFISGIVIGCIFSFLPNVNYSMVQLILAGGIAGLSACGVYQIATLATAAATSVTDVSNTNTPKESTPSNPTNQQ